MARHVLTLGLLVLTLAVPATTAGAQPLTDAALHRVRMQLAQYDLDGARTTDALRALRRVVRGSQDPVTIREASFLRAAVAADLLILSTRRGDPTLAARVAEAYGVDSTRLVTTLQQDLASVAVGHYAQTARDAGTALRIMAEETPDWYAVHGTRRDALFVAAARRALEEGGDPSAALAPLGVDPCSDEAALCPDPYVRFEVSARRALRALSELHAALTRLDRAATGGDPFSAALSSGLAADRSATSSVTLRALPILPDELILTHAHTPTSGARPDLAVVVTPTGFRYGWFPRVRVDAEGVPEVLAAGSPVLPETASVSLPVASYRPALRAEPSMVSTLAELAEVRQDAVVAVGAGDGVPAHLLARLLMSLERAELPARHLLARGDTGCAQVVPLEAVRERDRSQQVRVLVRLGGYSVNRDGGATATIPRVRGEEGLQFDVDGLEAAAGESIRSAQVRFMSSVEAGPVLWAAFRVAPSGAPLRLVLP